MKDLKELKNDEPIIACERIDKGIDETVTKVRRKNKGKSISVQSGYQVFKVIYSNKEEALNSTEERFCYMPTQEDIVRINNAGLKSTTRKDMEEIDMYVAKVKELIEEIDELRKDMI